MTTKQQIAIFHGFPSSHGRLEWLLQAKRLHTLGLAVCLTRLTLLTPCFSPFQQSSTSENSKRGWQSTNCQFLSKNGKLHSSNFIEILHLSGPSNSAEGPPQAQRLSRSHACPVLRSRMVLDGRGRLRKRAQEMRNCSTHASCCKLMQADASCTCGLQTRTCNLSTHLVTQVTRLSSQLL